VDVPREALRISHKGITLNNQSAKMEMRLGVALDLVVKTVRKQYGLTAVRENSRLLTDIIDELNRRYSQDTGVTFQRAFRLKPTYIRPDGGFWYIAEWGEPKRYILVAEAKRQGTNADRAREGLPKQSRGNAVERLGKNMRGVDVMFLGEMITPFVCFGEGDDFSDQSSIIDRVATLNGFFPLNRVFVDKINIGEDTMKPTSLFFRENPWTPAEMFKVMQAVARRAVEYYRERYGLA